VAHPRGEDVAGPNVIARVLERSFGARDGSIDVVWNA
jgi:hypothetical protein